MIESLHKRISSIVGLLPLGALFGLMAFVAKTEVRDLDLWLHLAVGKFITLNKIIPTTDILSHTMTGQSWNNHEWLFQVIIYNIQNAFGFDGLLGMQMGLVTVTMLILLFLGYSKDRQFEVAYTLLMVFFVYASRFTLRPDLFSLLFFSIYIFILALHIDKKWSLWILFIVQVLWTNMHGFFFFGPLFVFIGILSEWIKRHVPLPYEWNESGKLTDEEFAQLKKVFIFVILACLVNPQFAEGALYPFHILFSLSGDSKIFFKYIQELQVPITKANIFSIHHYVYYKMLIVFSALSFIFNRRRIDISALFFWIVFLVFSLKAVRNIPFFAFAAYLVIITNLVHFSVRDLFPLKFDEKKFEHITGTMIKLVLFLWIVQHAQVVAGKSYYDFDKYELKSEFGGISQTMYPDKAVDFLLENNVKGNFFNDFNSGAYMLGRLYPNIKVFIDGRTEVYGSEFFLAYQEMWVKGKSELFEEIEKSSNITGALLNSARYPIPKQFLNYIYDREDWKLVYFGYDGMVFLKDVEVNRELIKKFEIELEGIKPDSLDIYKVGSSRVVPYRNYYRARTLESLGFNREAKDECAAALKINPSYGNVYQLLGKIFSKEKNYEEAYKYFRVASTLSPSDRDVRINLARTFLDMGLYNQAINQLELILEVWSSDPKPYFFLSKAFALDKQYDKVIGTLSIGLSLNPGANPDALKIADVLINQKEYGLAMELLDLIKSPLSENIEFHKSIASVYQGLGDKQNALNSWGRALKLDSEDSDVLGNIMLLESE